MQTSKENGLTTFLQKLFDDWNRNSVQYAILRNYQELPDTVHHDIDVFVSLQTCKTAVKKLIDNAGLTGWAIYEIRNGVCMTIRLEHIVTKERFHFDVASGPRWYCFEFVDTQWILSHRRLYGELYVVDSVSEAFICMMLRLLYAGYVKKDYRTLIQDIAQSKRIEMLLCMERWLGSDLAEKLLNWACTAQWNKIEEEARRIRIRLVLSNFLRPYCMTVNLIHDCNAVIRRLLFQLCGGRKRVP